MSQSTKEVGNVANKLTICILFSKKKKKKKKKKILCFICNTSWPIVLVCDHCNDRC